MKATLIAAVVTAASLFGDVGARPMYAKRSLVTEYVFVTETVAEVTVYVDEGGLPFSTTTGIASSIAAATSTSTAVASTTVESSSLEAKSSVATPAPEATLSAAATTSVVNTATEPVKTYTPEPTGAPFTEVPAASIAIPSSIPSAPVVEEPAPAPEPELSSAAPAAPLTQAPEPPVTTQELVSSTTQESEVPFTTEVPDVPTVTQQPKASTTLQPEMQSTTQEPEPLVATKAPGPEAPANPPVDPPLASPSAVPSNPVYIESRSNFPLGVTYDPFTGTPGNARCKTEQEIADEFSRMKSYRMVRIYGMGCNIIPLAVKGAVANGQQLMAGSYLSNKGDGEDLSQVTKALKSAIDQYAGGNWDVIKVFSVANERVNDHDMTASEVVDAINRARGQLRGLGYNGPVGAVDTVPATVDNPSICKASDIVMVNSHAFFDGKVEASSAGPFVRSQIQRVKKACDTARVVVTESGWPHQGNANGRAVPSVENQKAALASIREEFSNDMFIFNAFDSPWKSDWSSSFNAERWWGVL